MKKSIYVLAVVAMFFTACKSDKKQADTKETHSKEMQMTKEDNHEHDHSSKKDVTSEIIDGYLQLKNALVADDQKGAAKAGKMMLAAFSNFDMTKLTESQHKEYMEIAENSREHAEHIVKSPIDHQREHFEELSTDMIDLITLLGTDKTLYQDFCPMYNNNKGGTWLSETKAIKNPYFGSKMLKCGKMQKQFN